MQKPVLDREHALLIMGDHYAKEKVILLGIRGFFDPAMGNKRGVYDDAVFLITDEGIEGFNFNTDPSIDRPGIAVLQDGKYDYTQDLHGVHHLNLKDINDKVLYNTLIAHHKDLTPIPGKILPYFAFRQAGPVLLKRDGDSDAALDGWPSAPAWIDIHKGGVNTTSSEGCQTVFPDQWEDFRDKGYAGMDKNSMHKISYVLLTKTADMDITS